MNLIHALISLVFSFGVCQSVNYFRLSRNFDRLNDLQGVKKLPEKWFTQILDHYNSSDMRTWKQRYYMNDEHYKKGGPIFLILGEEFPAESQVISDGFIFDLAKKFQAKCFLIEHRYHGKSQPVPELTIKNLSYLNSQQALMDTAYFINKIRSTNSTTSKSKWILFGSSYAGSLATWMKLKFPHLVHGVISQSAPLTAKIDIPEFFAVIHNTIKKYSESCFDAVSYSFKQFYIVMRDPNGLEKLSPFFRFCNRLEYGDIKTQMFDLYQWFLYMFTKIVANRSITLSDACDILTDDNWGTPLNRTGKLVEIYLGEMNESCIPPEDLDDTSVVMWIYQLCTEFGWYQTTASNPFNIFSQTIPVSTFLQQCVTLGSRYIMTQETGIERTNLMFGGTKISKLLSNVLFIQGSNDPWISVGVTNSNNSKAPVIIVNGTGHCPFTNPPLEDEQNEVGKAKLQMEKQIESWLN